MTTKGSQLPAAEPLQARNERTSMTTNTMLDEQIEQATKAAHEARAEAAAADRLDNEGTLDGDDAIRRHDDFIRKSARMRVLEREAARLLRERDGEQKGTPCEIIAREIERLKEGA